MSFKYNNNKLQQSATTRNHISKNQEITINNNLLCEKITLIKNLTTIYKIK